MKYIILLFSLTFFISCSKDDKPVIQQQDQQKVNSDESEIPADTNMTPEEKFSSSILVDFLGDSDDEYLGEFLETEVYKIGSAYNGTSVVEITPSTWLVTFEKDSIFKNYLLQKFVDLKSNDYYFSFKETNLTITDVISKPKTSAGE